MELITVKTTLEAFSNQDEWLVKEPKTGVLYQMHMGHLYGVGYYLRVKQSVRSLTVVYIRHRRQQSVLIESKRELLAMVKDKQFYIEWYTEYTAR